MKICPTCGHSESEDAHFCDACGADLTATAAEPTVAPALPVAAPPAPPAAPVYAPPAPPAYAPPMSASVSAPAPRVNTWLPWVIGALVLVAVIAGGFIVFKMFSSGPMSAADYKAEAIQYLGQMESAGSETSATLQLIASSDPAERAKANAAWDAAASETRAAMANLRTLRPPAEMQSIHDRLIKGIDATEKVIVVTDTLYAMLASGEINSSSPADTPAIKAFTDVASDTAISAALSDLTAAYNELKAK